MAVAIRRKPKNVSDFIKAGGRESAGKSKKKQVEDAIQPVKMRIDSELLDQIDAAVNARKPAPSRHQWILEAIYEKLARESKS
jgi:hypothetical protein